MIECKISVHSRSVEPERDEVGVAVGGMGNREYSEAWKQFRELDMRATEIITNLIKGADRCQKNNSVRIIEVRNPLVTLATSAANIIKVPKNGFSADLHHELMRGDSHSL